ncbi:MAG: hypothetical protein JXB39_14090 [Deltaproteobacteria bacterium]|nr:hypothetical protein [Deltaproteobacteria bacterium]
MAHVPSSLLTLLGLLACGSLHVDRSFVEAGRVDRIRVRWASGEIRVRAGGSDAVRVHAEAWGPEAPIAIHHHRDAEILEIALVCRTPVPCGGALELDVPAGVAIETDLGEGEAHLSGPLGSLSVVVGNGSIEAKGLTSQEAMLQVVRGPVEASWIRIPQRVVLASVEGNVHARVPAASYDVRWGGLEPVVLGVVVDPTVDRLIRVTTLDGEARVEGSGAVAHIRPVDPWGLVAPGRPPYGGSPCPGSSASPLMAPPHRARAPSHAS